MRMSAWQDHWGSRLQQSRRCSPGPPSDSSIRPVDRPPLLFVLPTHGVLLILISPPPPPPFPYVSILLLRHLGFKSSKEKNSPKIDPPPSLVLQSPCTSSLSWISQSLLSSIHAIVICPSSNCGRGFKDEPSVKCQHHLVGVPSVSCHPTTESNMWFDGALEVHFNEISKDLGAT